jgi:hypothetical protein
VLDVDAENANQLLAADDQQLVQARRMISTSVERQRGE